MVLGNSTDLGSKQATQAKEPILAIFQMGRSVFPVVAPSPRESRAIFEAPVEFVNLRNERESRAGWTSLSYLRYAQIILAITDATADMVEEPAGQPPIVAHPG